MRRAFLGPGNQRRLGAMDLSQINEIEQMLATSDNQEAAQTVLNMRRNVLQQQ